MAMSATQTAEGRVNFIRHARDAISTGGPLGAIFGGVIGGVFVEDAVTNYTGQQNAANHLRSIEVANHNIVNLLVKAEGHPAVETFLQNAIKGNTHQIHEIQSTAPPHAGVGEDLAFIGGGALIGALALSAIFLTLARDRI